ncbi:hypothetical protein, partial [Acinetobacter baumannii]|uniref:hypothetical protein n=1 Tax=Acinetobacter baumannii TaxID=470 RepID=UPI001BB46991
KKAASRRRCQMRLTFAEKFTKAPDFDFDQISPREAVIIGTGICRNGFCRKEIRQDPISNR